VVLADLKLIVNTVSVMYGSFAQTSANQKILFFSLFSEWQLLYAVETWSCICCNSA